jgi:hypothetical protein
MWPSPWRSKSPHLWSLFPQRLLTGAQRSSQLAKQFPRSGTPFLYLGITQLLMNDNTNAFFNLTRAEQFVSSVKKDTASWYRAIAAMRANDPNARQLLHTICRRNGSPYAQQACQIEQGSQ